MPSNYPAAIDSFTVPSTGTLGGTTPTLPEVQQKAADALTAIENTLGVNPQGADSSVKARLDRVDTRPSLHAGTHAVGGTDPVTPAAIGAQTPAGTTAAIATHSAATGSGQHAQYLYVKGQTTAPGIWIRPSTSPFPTVAEGATETDLLLLY